MGKRVLDVGLGTLLALVALPLIAVLAFGVAISLRCSPFFVHTRIGRHGRPFRLVKLRTLPPTVPAYLAKSQFDGVRTTRFGAFLRATHLDELPQLLLVPLGRMSLVGPRPEMPALHEQFDSGFARARSSVRPGCSGLWQISADCHRMIADAPEYDEFYLRHHSLLLDLWILASTARSVVLGNPQVRLEDVPRWALGGRMGAPTPSVRPDPALPAGAQLTADVLN